MRDVQEEVYQVLTSWGELVHISTLGSPLYAVFILRQSLDIAILGICLKLKPALPLGLTVE